MLISLAFPRFMHQSRFVSKTSDTCSGCSMGGHAAMPSEPSLPSTPAVLLLGHADPGPRGRAGGHQCGLPGQIEELNRDICLKRCAISTHHTLRPSPRGPEGGEAVGLVDDLAIQVRKLPALGCRLPRPMPIAKNDGHEFPGRSQWQRDHPGTIGLEHDPIVCKREQ